MERRATRSHTSFESRPPAKEIVRPKRGPFQSTSESSSAAEDESAAYHPSKGTIKKVSNKKQKTEDVYEFKEDAAKRNHDESPVRLLRTRARTGARPRAAFAASDSEEYEEPAAKTPTPKGSSSSAEGKSQPKKGTAVRSGVPAQDKPSRFSNKRPDSVSDTETGPSQQNRSEPPKETTGKNLKQEERPHPEETVNLIEGVLDSKNFRSRRRQSTPYSKLKPKPVSPVATTSRRSPTPLPREEQREADDSVMVVDETLRDQTSPEMDTVTNEEETLTKRTRKPPLRLIEGSSQQESTETSRATSEVEGSGTEWEKDFETDGETPGASVPSPRTRRKKPFSRSRHSMIIKRRHHRRESVARECRSLGPQGRPSEPPVRTGPYNLRRNAGQGRRDGEDESSRNSADDCFGIHNRYPKRSARLPDGALADPATHLAGLDSEVSNLDEPIKKKRKAIRNSGESGEGNGEFEPTVHFPSKESKLVAFNPPIRLSDKDSGFLDSSSSISFDTIGGLLAIKDELRRELLIPFREHIQRIDSRVDLDETIPTQHLTKGALFWGPPGTGKTLMAKAIAFEVSRDLDRHVPVYVISGAELLTKWVGESESHLRLIFEAAKKNSPSIVFIDELDGLVRRRTTSETDHVNFNMVSTLLTLLNGALDRGSVLVIATTNFKDVIDPALIRSGRFDLKIFFPAPSLAERMLIIQALTHKWKNQLNEHNARIIASNTEGCTGADLDLLSKKARNFAISGTEGDAARLDVEVGLHDFFKALLEVEPSGHSSAGPSSSFEALDGRTGTLLNDQLDDLITYLATTFPVKLPGKASLSDNSALWATFSNRSLLLDYNPVLFMYTKNDPLMLHAVTSALFQQLSLKNTVKTVDFCQISTTSSFLDQLAPLLHERSSVVGMFSLNEACHFTADKLCVDDPFVLAMQKRNKLHAPLLIVTSNVPPEDFAPNELERVFGKDVNKFEVERPTEKQIREFFHDLFTHETLAIDITVEGSYDSSLDEDKLMTFLDKLVRHLRNNKGGLDSLLTLYRSLSQAIWEDRQDPTKTAFKKLVRSLTDKRCRSGADAMEADLESNPEEPAMISHLFKDVTTSSFGSSSSPDVSGSESNASIGYVHSFQSKTVPRPPKK